MPRENEGNCSVFLFPHQDDEYFVAPFLKKSGSRSLCFFLTLGEGKGIPSQVRNRESQKVLRKLGIPDGSQFFLPPSLSIPDLELQNYLEQALYWIQQAIQEKTISSVVCPAWEGGHPDHDSGFLLGLALGKIANCEVWAYPLYRSHPKLYPFFTVMGSPKGVLAQSQSLRFWERLFYAFLFLEYPSQRKTWIGLGPFAIAKILGLGKFSLFRFSPEDSIKLPQAQWTYYEKRGMGSFSQFIGSTKYFREKYLS